MLWFDKATHLSLLFKFILFVRLSNNLWGLGVQLFLELVNIVSIMFYNFIKLIILLYNFFVIPRYKDYAIRLISFSKFSDVLPAFTCARAIGNLWNICLGVNVFSSFPYDGFNRNMPLLKALRVNSWPS